MSEGLLKSFKFFKKCLHFIKILKTDIYEEN